MSSLNGRTRASAVEQPLGIYSGQPCRRDMLNFSMSYAHRFAFSYSKDRCPFFGGKLRHPFQETLVSLFRRHW